MYDNQYLVTVYHRKKHKLVQKLTKGDLFDARRLICAISYEYFNNDKHLIGSVVEITKDAINTYVNPNEIFMAVKRDLNADMYVYQIFYENYPEYICTSDEDFIDEVTDELRTDKEKKNPHYVLNRINFRGLYKLDCNGETRICYTNYPNCYKEDFIEESIATKI